MVNPKIRGMFSLHAMSSDEIETARVIRDKIMNVAELIDDACPESREKSMTFTKLDEACMYAVASIARQNPIKE